LRLNAFFTPSEITPGETAATTGADDIYIVVDVIRATTSMAVMFDCGAQRVFAAGNLEHAREAAQQFPGRLLCGERNVQRVPGFDYGNSPVEFSRLDLSGRELIHTTTNGTRAFYACPEHTIRLAGCLYNAEAVAARALELAQERNSNISIVCSGEFGYFALDDAVCAGYLALELQRQYAAIFLHESVEAAIALYEAYKPPIIIDHCRSARSVIEAGLPEDVYFCMQTSLSKSVPVVVGRESETGLLVIERS
jgi:2-phosphosulfolactate phosphatase